MIQELRWVYDRRELAEARRDIAQWLTKWQGKYPKLCDWAEDNIEETLTYYRLPLAHHKHMKSTDEVDKRIFCRRSSLLGRGRPRGKERGIGWKPRQAACSIVPWRFEALAHPTAWSSWAPLADKLLVGSLGLFSNRDFLGSEGLDVVGIGRSALVSLLRRAPCLQFQAALLLATRAGRAQR